ncbi:MAG: PorV/PorQ family protein [Candidatus Eisenbacteria bacterium]|nr:PorV/PorQ family protein [Candidatus Eisenbacteria bacterium]
MSKASGACLVLAFVLGVSLWGNAYAIGEAGAQFLKMGVGARACAMGEAYVAIADDATAIYWNTAGLAEIQSPQITAMQNFWLADMSYQYLGLVCPSRLGSLGISAAYSSSGEIPKYENFQREGEYSAYDAAGTIAYARRLMGSASYGVSVKFIQEKIEEESARGFGVDVGLLCAPGILHGLKLGVAVNNMGPGIKFIEKADPLPLSVRVGAAYKTGPLLLAGDLGKPRDNDAYLCVGGELGIRDILALRAGYNSANSYSAGIGLKWRRVSVDYAYVPYEYLGDTHRFSAGVRF